MGSSESTEISTQTDQHTETTTINVDKSTTYNTTNVNNIFCMDSRGNESPIAKLGFEHAIETITDYDKQVKEYNGEDQDVEPWQNNLQAKMLHRWIYNNIKNGMTDEQIVTLFHQIKNLKQLTNLKVGTFYLALSKTHVSPELLETVDEMKANVDEITTLKQENENSKNTVTALQTLVDGIKPEIDAIKPEIDAMKPQIDAMKPQIDAMKPEIDAMKANVAEITTLKQENENLKNTVTALQTLVDGIKPDIDAMKANVAEITTLKQEIENLKNTLKTQMDELKPAITAEYQKQITDLKTEISSVIKLPTP